MARQADLDEANSDKHKLDVKDKGLKWERSCTDTLFCLVFTFAISAMLLASAYGLKNGDPMKIITPFDSVGNKCGATN
jgi:hypothetical protein